MRIMANKRIAWDDPKRRLKLVAAIRRELVLRLVVEVLESHSVSPKLVDAAARIHDEALREAAEIFALNGLTRDERYQTEFQQILSEISEP